MTLQTGIETKVERPITGFAPSRDCHGRLTVLQLREPAANGDAISIHGESYVVVGYFPCDHRSDASIKAAKTLAYEAVKPLA